ncbi:f84a4824-6e3e-4a89-8f3f-4debcf8e65ce [Sclerotinia trifoliorum]|uniref:alpha-amylase n=1 Tax=Sclerotinia trifoliorum TaxID=28548 RepID=A0A8H2ZP91_9HELO|nr:f84a4824-6e3e-4a89-8f3f-4debcf8e65ce [Sclerotinia trifoliorum]
MFSYKSLFTALVCLTSLDGVLSATPDEWRTRSIYQVFTDRFARTDASNTTDCPSQTYGYCGGTWQGIINRLDYIQDMGFTAIWISPVVEQVADPNRGFHGYSAQNLYGLNSHFGTASDLTALANALHDRGMYLMVDVVANHMGSDDTAHTVDYSIMNPFNESKYFHEVCFITDYNNQTNVELCQLGTEKYPLPDLNTTQPAVRNFHTTWIKSLVANYTIDGLRVDTVRHVEKDFWPLFNEAAGVYCVGEVADGDVDYLCDYQNYMDGLLSYASYYQLITFFSNTSATSENLIGQIQHQNTECTDTTLLATFTENHDQPRFGNYTSDLTLAKNIITCTLLADGIPIIYQGQEQHFHGATDPYDREPLWPTNYNTSSPLYVLVKQLNAIRSLAIARSSTYPIDQTQVAYSDPHNLAFRKGDSTHMVLMVLNNIGATADDYTIEMNNVGFEAGLIVTDVLSCRNVAVDMDGGMNIPFESGLPSVYYPFNLLAGTGWCGQY